MNDKQTYIYTLTDFSDPDQIAVPLVLANAALAMGKKAMLWTTLEGVNLAKKGSVDEIVSPSFSSVSEIFEEFKQAGGQIGVCPACAKTHGVTEENLVENGVWMGAAAITEATQNSNSMSF
ncbi:MAG: DsrE family protein [Gammaproteobacteria bacterium]|nr:DsrE family protein [Gammaproteobacteria bacterium]